MLTRITSAIFASALLVSIALSNIAFAQTVDPCWYGCPKEGCPKCGGGGPIGKLKAEATGEACLTRCQEDASARAKDCSDYFPPKSDAVKHRDCLARAKPLLDACQKIC